jgi:HEPN domain-containing protein
MENKGRLFSRKSGLWLLSGGLVLISILFWISIQYRSNLRLADVLKIRAEKMEVLSRMRADLLRSVEAEKDAVMADTDESSLAFAAQSRQATQAMDKDRQELRLLMEKDYSGQETRLLQEFDRCATELQEVDQSILDLAVKNTNLKAMKLSFGPGRAALKRFEKALQVLTRAETSSTVHDQIAEKTCKALVAALKIHDLQAPHIASPNDEEMDKIEANIMRNADEIKTSLSQMRGLVPEEDHASFKEAESANEEFAKVTREVLDLSRQNTNIKSFELSLGRKRSLTAQCDEILVELEEVLRSKEFRATR